MDEADIEKYAAATRRYIKLRRRFLFVIGSGLIVWPFAFAMVVLAGHALQSGKAWIVLIAAFLAYWVSGATTSIMLSAFRCPRCDKPFIGALGKGWPTDSCKHCDLRLG